MKFSLVLLLASSTQAYKLIQKNPDGAESKLREDDINLANWGRQGNLTTAHNKTDNEMTLVQLNSDRDYSNRQTVG